MHLQRGALLGAALLTLPGIAFAQGQPNTTVSRTVGLDVLGTIGSTFLDTTQNGIVLTVHGPSGTAYDLHLEISLAAADFSMPLPPFVGPLTQPFTPSSIYFQSGQITPPSPTLPLMAGAFVDPTGGTPGLIPPNATSQTLVSTFQLPANIPANFQVAALDPVGNPINPAGTFYWTNGQQRPVIAPPTNLGLSGYLGATGTPVAGAVLDVEQADMDGDGDLDEVAVGSPPTGWTFSTVSFPAGGPMRTTGVQLMAGVASATTAEFADFNQDGLLDLVVGGTGPNSTSNLQVFLNAGAPNFLNPGNPAQINFLPLTFKQPFNVNDVETGDFNGDGLIDIVTACGGGCAAPEVNRYFYGSFTGGVYALNEVPGPLVAGQPVLDDSRDCEVFDLDGDGDLDVYFANFDGVGATLGRSVNVYHTNNGVGGFAAVASPEAPTQSIDVLLADFDLDGDDDCYVGNFAQTSLDCSQFVAGASDNLLINMGGAFVDMSGLIPFDFWFTTDVEGVSMPTGEILSGANVARDYDGDGDVDIFLGLGLLGATIPNQAPGVPGTSSGILILQNLQADSGFPAGTLPNFGIDFSALSTIAAAADVADIELGDWLNPAEPVGRWFEKDIGVGSINQGHEVLSKQP